MNRAIKHQYHFNQSPAEVWEYLTNPVLLEQWLMKNDFQPVVGHEFRFQTNALPAFDFDGIVYCKVLELEPFKKLTYSWKGGPGNGIMTMDSTVYWTLAPAAKGTDLFLEHSGFEGMENLSIFYAMQDGWLKNIQKIEKLLNTATHG